MQPKDLSLSAEVYIQKPRGAYGYIILNFTTERKPWQHSISAANAGALKGGHSPWKVTELSSGFSSKAFDIRQSSTRSLQMFPFTFRLGGKQFQMMALPLPASQLSGIGPLWPLVLTVEATSASKLNSLSNENPWQVWGLESDRPVFLFRFYCALDGRGLNALPLKRGRW